MQLETIVWDGTSLSTIIAIDNRRVTCVIPRDTVHALSTYRDALGWEIDRYKFEIFERLKVAVERKLQNGPSLTQLQLVPADLQ